MLSADSTTPLAAAQALYDSDEDDEPSVTLTEILTWFGEKKALIGAWTLGVALALARRCALMPLIYTARTTFLGPGSQQQSGSAAALSALGGLAASAAR